jgi:hypothetical protein
LWPERVQDVDGLTEKWGSSLHRALATSLQKIAATGS